MLINYIVNYIDDQGGIVEDLTGKKKMLTHTIAPSLKFNLGELKINLNGNPRLGMVYRRLSKIDSKAKQAIQDQAKIFLDQLDSEFIDVD